MFKLLGITMIGAVAIGYAMRGKIERLADLRFTLLPVLFVSLVVGMLPLFVEMPRGPSRALTTLANVGVLAFLVVNAARHAGAVRFGLAVLLAGWALNALVIGLNDGMPLSEWAYAKSGQSDEITEGKGGFFKIVVADEDTRLRFLGDVIPIEPLKQVISAGDVLLSVGIAIVVAAGMRRSGDR